MSDPADRTEFSLEMPFFIDTDGYTDRDREMFVCGVEFYMWCRRSNGTMTSGPSLPFQ